MIEGWIVILIRREHGDEKNAANINWNLFSRDKTPDLREKSLIHALLYHPSWSRQERGLYFTSLGSCDIISLRVTVSFTREAAATDRDVRPFHSGGKL